MLLAAGLSHIQITRRTGLSRRTISRIAKEGRRRKLVAADISDERPAGFDTECLNRCRGCGARIYLWPCMQCEIRAKAEARDEVRRLIRQGESHTEAQRHGEGPERL
jgi:DNA-binding transcriptional regulator LsrR (DeoR family)